MTESLFYEVVACTGKIAHETKAEALRVMRRRRLKRDMSVYRCKRCRKWHIGHSERRDLER